MLRRIHGPVLENDVWRRKITVELNDLIKIENTITSVKARRIKWIGLIYVKDDVEEDLRRLWLRGWRRLATDRDTRRRLESETQIQSCSVNGSRRRL